MSLPMRLDMEATRLQAIQGPLAIYLRRAERTGMDQEKILIKESPNSLSPWKGKAATMKSDRKSACQAHSQRSLLVAAADDSALAEKIKASKVTSMEKGAAFRMLLASSIIYWIQEDVETLPSTHNDCPQDNGSPDGHSNSFRKYPGQLVSLAVKRDFDISCPVFAQ
uniref:Uncharacterized protein n=1 Tax=Sphaerodactylus townsendi TaxID=933632 RepID=A0ACB8EA80_9SAUR